MSERVIPAAGYLVVRRDEATGVVGGIVIPDTVKAAQKTCTGVVLAMGPQVWGVVNGMPNEVARVMGGQPVPIDVGCKVIFDLFVGTSISRDNVRVNDREVILKAEDILGVVVEDR